MLFRDVCTERAGLSEIEVMVQAMGGKNADIPNGKAVSWGQNM
jgi:hypothetical protein